MARLAFCLAITLLAVACGPTNQAANSAPRA